MGHCFSKKLLPPELNTDTSSESSENSEDSEKESVKKDGGSVKVNKSTKKPTKISSKNPNVGKTAAFSKSDPVKSTKGGTKLSPKKITAVSGSSKPSASSKQTSSPSTKPGGSKASSKSSPSPGGIGGKAKATVAAASAASKSSKTPPPPPSTFRIPPKATTAVEMKRNKTPNVVARVAPQSTAKNPEPVQQAPPPPPQPPPPPFQTPVEQPKIEQIKTEFLSEQSYSDAMPSGFGGFPETTAKMATFPKEPPHKTEIQQQQQQQPPPFSQANYHERPRVLQLNNGSTLNLPNAEDYNRQLNDAQLQAQIKSYFEEMMAQMKLTQQMVQSSPQQQQLQQPPPPTQSPLLSGGPQQQQQPLLQHDQAQHSRMQQQQPLQLAGNTTNQYSPLAQQYQQQQPMTGQQAPVSGQYQAPSGFQQPPQQPFSAGTGGQYPQCSQQHQPSQLYPPTNSPSAVMTPQQAPPAHHPMSYPSAPSMQHLPSHNSIGNSSYIRPQATSSQLFPSLQPHPPPAMVSNQHHHHHPPRQQIKHHMPPQQLQQQQHRPQVIEGTFNQTGGGPFPLSTPQPTMGFPAFPPMTPVSRPITPKTKVGPAVDFFAPPPSSFFPPSQPPFPARLETPQVNQWQNFGGGGSGSGGFPAPTPPTANFPPPPTFGANNFPPCTPVFPTGFNFDASSGGKRDQVDCTNEQMEAIQRDIQELRREIQDKEWSELMAKMEQVVIDCKKMKAVYANTVQELKKDERFRVEKNRINSEVYAIYSRLKNDFKEFSSSIENISRGTKQMVNQVKRGYPSGAKPVMTVKQQDLQKTKDQMDRIIKGLTQLKNAFEAVFPAKQNVNFC